MATMFGARWLYILAVVYFSLHHCELYEDRPTIKTLNGNLYLKPALNKNIYLTPNGPESGIYVEDINLLKMKNDQKGDIQQWTTTNGDLDELINGPNGILQRIQSLENKDTGVSSDLILNVTTLARRVDNLNRKVRFLQVQLTNRVIKDECQSNPCQQGGTCLNLANGYYCLCPQNWEGKDCDTDVNECRNIAGTDLGCQNGATCINRPGSYECLCRSGWFGLHCTRKEKDCSGGDYEMCGYGTCVQVSSGVGIKCICQQGWTTNGTGIECSTDINECGTSHGCSANPRVDCINLPGSFRCGACPQGYEGDGFRCSDIDECTAIPNGGCSSMVTCHNTIGSRVCGICPPGYQGDGVTCTWRGACNINHGGCHPSAQCIELRGTQVPQCICPEGMNGNGVGISGCYVTSLGNYTLDCDSNPCGSNGQCHNLRNGYTCVCYKGYGGGHCDAPLDYCATNPCSNGGICRADLSTARGFRCECTAQFAGPLCQVRFKSCGGLLDAEEGSILYPMTNNSMYTHNSQCAWVIRTVPDKIINVTFTKFDLEESPECTYDFLQIHDGAKSASQLIGRYCGRNYPKGGNILSSHNNLYLWFHSDKTVAKEGFALHWTSVSPVCGGDVDATTHGRISSPGSPGPYPPNRDCYWHLTTALGKRISLHFFALDIEAHTNCSFDYLAIYDGENESDDLIDKYCSSTQPASVQSRSPELLIHFHSDAYGRGNGFQIVYEPVASIPGCGGYYTQNMGEITSPSYDSSFLNSLICEYKIKTSIGTRIKIEFTLFTLAPATKCRFDSLTIYDGSSKNSPFVGKFCGNNYPRTYTSSSNNMYLKFVDRSLGREGFKLIYKTVCEKLLFGDSGVITSPGYPFTYPVKNTCFYVIRANPGKAIQLTFQQFDLELNSECRFDTVEIRDGDDSSATLLGKFCSRQIPPMQTSTHNFMYIKFYSDMSVTGTGFYANYTTIDIECGGIYRDTTGIINFPAAVNATYKNEQKCTWILIAPEGMHIKLTWNRFALEEMPHCISDYLQLFLIDEYNKKSDLGKFCGNNAPPAITTATNRLLLKFQSDFSVNSNGFSVSYTFLDDNLHCDRMYYKKNGYFYSPRWTKKYTPNHDCTWIISVPVGQQILLNVSQFNLLGTTSNKCDFGEYLEIRNGDNADSPLIGQYCGSFQSRLFKSLTNVLYLHFHSNVVSSGTGFKIEWDGTLTGCGGKITGVRGSISSPNYPNNYNDNLECFYKITTNSGSRIVISFTDLKLEQTYQCTSDYVEIYDGRDVNARTIGRYCSMTSSADYIETSKNNVFIKFRTDMLRTAKGFVLNFETHCNSNLSGRYGVIESPGYPDGYPLNISCLWNIKVPRGNRINVTFTSFDVYMLRTYSLPWHPISCDSHYLQIRESFTSDFSNKSCGNSLPSHIHTKSNFIQIKFVTGTFSSRPGFRLEWILDGCGGHIQKMAGSIVLDKSFTSQGVLECEWLIETQIGSSVTIQFTTIFMQESKECSLDAIEIYSGRDVHAPMISKICHQKAVTVQSDSNAMFIKFVKQSSLKDVHFKSNFYSLKAKCGGIIHSMSGIIQSPDYPQNYDNKLNCDWFVSVPQNHRIEFKIIDLDLYSVSDFYDLCLDSIKIFEGASFSNSNYSYRICPNSNITEIIVNNNNMIVEFLTDSSGSAKGFKASFTVICGAIINDRQDGVIENQQFISNTNNSCVWTINSPSMSEKLSLTLKHISVPINSDIVTNRKCPSSYLRVYDGNDINAPLIDEYCGRKVPPMIVSHSSAITLELGSYTDRIMGYFVAHYSSFNNTCGGKLTAEMGSIASPNYPGPYPGNIDCEWNIITSPGGTAYVTFERFDLKSSYKCNEEYVEIRENNGAGRLQGIYCGSKIPTNNTLASKIYIKFHTTSQSSGQGFLLHYGYIHNNMINGDRGAISSPLYPLPYHGSGDFTWQIIGNEYEKIIMNINTFLLPAYGDTSDNTLRIYDGLDVTYPLLEEMQGVLSVSEPSKTVQTTSNAVFIKLKMSELNPGSLFYLKWSKLYKAEELTDNDGINCGSNRTEWVLVGNPVLVNSPNYPNKYNDNLKCNWIFKSQTGRHLKISFNDFKLEEINGCTADFVSIYSSETGANWVPVVTNICLSTKAFQSATSGTYMKIEFQSDSSVSRTGFQARVYSECGGLVTDRSGRIRVFWVDYSARQAKVNGINCDWVIKVRPGRTIKLQFTHFNITNTGDTCLTSVTLRNGDSTEAPFLSNGKYCGYSNENKTGIETSSNTLFVSFRQKFEHISSRFQNFILRYEENNIECGFTSQLSLDKEWEIISSPKYPTPPVPYTNCEWVFTGPPGEVLRVDFIDRFDLHKTKGCEEEFIEIRDGSLGTSPILAFFCERQGTIKSTNNVLYVRYSTQLDAPNNGFKANISIDICGGTIIASSGEITSPGYPNLNMFQNNVFCEWRIIGPSNHAFEIQAVDINLPDSVNNCGNYIIIEETVFPNNTKKNLQRYCSNARLYSVARFTKTLKNQFSIILHIGVKFKRAEMDSSRGFHFTFNSSLIRCGGKVTMPEGYLTTPNYPYDTSQNFCQWVIEVPNKNRRIQIELLDFDAEKQGIGIFTDLNFFFPILRLSGNHLPIPSRKLFDSSGNKMSLYIWMNSEEANTHRFEAKFDSDENALCGGELRGLTGDFTAPTLNRSYSCEWHYYQEITDVQYSNYKSVYVTIKLNSSLSSGVQCHVIDPKLTIETSFKNSESKFIREICRNSEISYRIPSIDIDFKSVKDDETDFNFNLTWKVQPCGGVVNVEFESINILNIPNIFNDTLDCAWVVIAPTNNKVEIRQEGAFRLDCDDQYVKIMPSLIERHAVIKHLCRDEQLLNPLIIHYHNIYIQYHSKAVNNTDIKLLVKSVTSECGGIVTGYRSTFWSPGYPKNYPPNQNCVWELQTHTGYRISFAFIDRMAVEDTPECKNDVIIIYDWKDNNYVEMIRICGRKPPPAIKSTFNRMKVILRTDNQTHLDGFKAHWGSFCGGSYTATEKNEILYSPGYPYNYPSSTVCKYEISAQDKKVFVKFLDFELEGFYPACKSDNVTISVRNGYEHLSEIYCERKTPPILVHYGTVSISLKTDAFLQRKGFAIGFGIYKCGGKIYNDSILDSNENGAEYYGTDLNCTWLIEAPKSKVVVLKFQYIDLEGTGRCSYDYIAVYEGLTMNDDNRLALMCGYINSTTVVRSKSRSAILTFVTDSSASRKGFKVNIFFSYSESVGCGGAINLTSTNSYTLKSPLVGNNVVYENYLECHWTVISPPDTKIKILFSSFHISSCFNINQTLIDNRECDCDLVEIIDGFSPKSLVIGTYCGNSLPPQLISSNNIMGIRFHSDGELVSSGFVASLTAESSLCGVSLIIVDNSPQTLKSPEYDKGILPRNLHCAYYIDASTDGSLMVRITILKLDLAEPELTKPGIKQCTGDKLVISSVQVDRNKTFGKDFVLSQNSDDFFANIFTFYDNIAQVPSVITLCGQMDLVDYYVYGPTAINLITSAETGSRNYKGFEIEVSYTGHCGRNYTEPYGRIQSALSEVVESNDCFTLITAPENYTISIYFISITFERWDVQCYLEIFDGNQTNPERMIKNITVDYNEYPIFSTGRYLLLHNHQSIESYFDFDLNYLATNKGVGCGGKLVNMVGKLTSPRYPNGYRMDTRCEWDIETPVGTRVLLRFEEFDVGNVCDKNYLQLVDSKGDVYSTYCSESTPADFTSRNNFVKIVSVTSRNNNGRGWVIAFVGVI